MLKMDFERTFGKLPKRAHFSAETSESQKRYYLNHDGWNLETTRSAVPISSVLLYYSCVRSLLNFENSDWEHEVWAV